MIASVRMIAEPPRFQAVSQWYVNFEQTTDDEVRHLLALARQQHHGGRGRAMPARPGPCAGQLRPAEVDVPRAAERGL